MGIEAILALDPLWEDPLIEVLLFSFDTPSALGIASYMVKRLICGNMVL